MRTASTTINQPVHCNTTNTSHKPPVELTLSSYVFKLSQLSTANHFHFQPLQPEVPIMLTCSSKSPQPFIISLQLITTTQPSPSLNLQQLKRINSMLSLSAIFQLATSHCIICITRATPSEKS